MKQMIIAALVMLLATSAMAYLDPTPNTVGVYLDTGAEEMCVEGLVDGNTDFTLYMIITNPTFSTMDGFVAGYHFNGTANVNSVVLAEASATDGGFLGEHIINFASPVPTSSSTLLMTLSATYFDFEYGSARLMLHSIPLDKTVNAPFVMLGGGETLALHLTYEEGLTIRINAGCDLVANDNLTIDGVKSLYR